MLKYQYVVYFQHANRCYCYTNLQHAREFATAATSRWMVPGTVSIED